MSLDKELEGAAGKEVGEQIARVAQDKDKAEEFSQTGVFDQTPVYLGLFGWSKREMMIDFGDLFPERSRVLDHGGIANLDPPGP